MRARPTTVSIALASTRSSCSATGLDDHVDRPLRDGGEREIPRRVASRIGQPLGQRGIGLKPCDGSDERVGIMLWNDESAVLVLKRIRRYPNVRAHDRQSG